ncbi:MAG TPA: hypothetical protein PK467_03825 [Candidatus Wallbacteria bacterium]|nr:hypothetical protein [Candidatus Wallbacteria bacterium]
MKDKLLNFIRTAIENKLFKSAAEHFLKPLIATLALALLFYIIIYAQNETTRIGDGFFIYYAMLAPFLINSAVSFSRLEKRKKFAAYGLSVVAVPFLAVNFYWLSSKYSNLPEFYRAFNESGSFFMLYMLYSVFFVIGGVFIGLIDEFVASESAAVLKYPESGPISKSKRRKLKKKKRDVAKGGAVSHEILDEIIGEPDDVDEEGGDKSQPGESEEEDSPDDEAQEDSARQGPAGGGNGKKK